MQSQTQVTFSGVRTVRNTSRAYDDVLERLHEQLGDKTLAEAVARAATAASESEYVRDIREKFAGPSDFMRFATLDHGSWIARFGVKRRSTRWIIGNPTIAIKLLRLDISAGLFVPIELLITEALDGQGTILTYVLPSSLIAIDSKAWALREEAEKLDAKLTDLIETVATN